MIRIRIQARHMSSTRARWLACFLLASMGCDGGDRISSPAPDNTHDQAPAFAVGRFSGIPFGATAQPIGVFGPIYTGGLVNPVYPD